jgi:DNA processing protein
MAAATSHSTGALLAGSPPWRRFLAVIVNKERGAGERRQAPFALATRGCIVRDSWGDIRNSHTGWHCAERPQRTNFALLLKAFGNIEAARTHPLESLGRAGIEPQFVRAFRGADELTTPMQNWPRWTSTARGQSRGWTKSSRVAARDSETRRSFHPRNAGPHFDQAVAVVGTRRVTPYRRQATGTSARRSRRPGWRSSAGWRAGWTDRAQGRALECGAPTVAVLAGGVDRVFPAENIGWRAHRGAGLRGEQSIRSAFLRGPTTSPGRNRILSGLARATLVVEQAEERGAAHC